MSHNYRQARRSGYVLNEGYHIALARIGLISPYLSYTGAGAS